MKSLVTAVAFSMVIGSAAFAEPTVPSKGAGSSDPAAGKMSTTPPVSSPTTGDESLTKNPGDKRAQDAATPGGSTANPTAKPDESSIQKKQQETGSGQGTNTATDPNATPTDSSVQTKQQQDSGATK